MPSFVPMGCKQDHNERRGQVVGGYGEQVAVVVVRDALVVHHVHVRLVAVVTQRVHPRGALVQQVELLLLIGQLRRDVEDVLVSGERAVSLLCKWRGNISNSLSDWSVPL